MTEEATPRIPLANYRPIDPTLYPVFRRRLAEQETVNPMPNKPPADGLSASEAYREKFDREWAARIKEGIEEIRDADERDRQLFRDVGRARQNYKTDTKMELLERAMAEIEVLEQLAAKYRAGMIVANEAFFAESKLRSEEKKNAE